MAGAVVLVTDGAAFRYPPTVQPFARFHYDPANDYREDVCEIDPDKVRLPFTVDPRCIDPPDGHSRLLVLWGDSHAASLYQGLEALRARGAPIRIAQMTAGACPPLLGLQAGKRARCLEYTDQVLENIRRLRPDSVVLGGAWAAYATRAGSSEGELTALQQTVRQLEASGVRRVVVFGSLPVWTVAEPNVVVKVWRDTGEVPERNASYLEPSVAEIDRQVHEAVAGTGAVFVSPLHTLCSTAGCLLSAQRDPIVPVTWDTNHLTTAGSKLLLERNEAAVLGEPSR
jgi:hypothetical protein